MKSLTVQLPDDVYDRAERRAAARGATLEDEVVEALERRQTDQGDANLAIARARMTELFRTVKGFRMVPRIPREELYERGSLR